MSETNTGNSFEVTLREMRRGRTLSELSEALATLVARVRETGRAGCLTYKLTVKPASAGDDVTVQLEDDVQSKLPRMARDSSIFFANEQNGLQRTDPRQKEFELREVAKAAPTPAPEAVNQ